MINKRLPDLSCNEEEYEKAKPLYETALTGSGYETSLTYTHTTERELATLYGLTHFIAKMLKPTNHRKVFLKLKKTFSKAS